jgi:2-methylcitrate dehydratase PrpD
MPMQHDDLTSATIAEIRAIARADLPDDVRAIAKLCILDWIGVAVAGSREPLVQMLIDEADCRAAGACLIVGNKLRAAPVSAALINGAAGDALDFSDCIRAMNGHATATVLPAALAAAETCGSSGRDLLRAFVVGVEAVCRVGRLAGEGILATAFHPTAVLGPFGAAAAAAHLLELDDTQWKAAFGIAATTAAGLAASVGTMAKPLHAGTAASNGLLAARLARRGFTGSNNALGNPVGFLTAHSKAPDLAALQSCRGRFFIRETLPKEHAACQLTHGSIDNMRAIRARERFTCDDIKEVRLAIAESSVRICDIAAPRTGLEAKFSIRTLAAMALLGFKTEELDTFNDALVASPEIAALRDRVTVEGRASLDVAQSLASVALRDGRAFTAQTDERDIDPDLARRAARTAAKFSRVVQPFMSAQAISNAQALVMGLEELGSLDPLFALLSGLSQGESVQFSTPANSL